MGIMCSFCAHFVHFVLISHSLRGDSVSAPTNCKKTKSQTERKHKDIQDILQNERGAHYHLINAGGTSERKVHARYRNVRSQQVFVTSLPCTGGTNAMV